MLFTAERLVVMALAITFCCTQTGAWIALVALLLLGLLANERLTRLRSLIDSPLLPALLCFSGALLISSFVAGGLSEAVKTLSFLRGTILIYLIAYQLFLAQPRIAPIFISTLLVCGALSGVFGFIQQVFNFHPFTYPYLQATGFLSDPMSFAGLMQLTSFLALGLLLKRGYSFLALPLLQNRVGFIAITALNFVGLIFASERSAWLGMAAALLSVCLYISPRALFRGLAALVAAAVIGWFFVPVVKARIEPLMHYQSDVSVSARFSIWSKSWQIFQEHPVTGIGPRRFPRIEMPVAIVPDHSKDLNHAHSNYFQMLATLGVLGFAAFIYLLASQFFVSYRQSRLIDPRSAGIGLGLFGAFISLSIAGLFEYNFGSGQVKLVQWFLTGMLLSAGTASGAAADDNANAGNDVKA
jgi:O-antigen ligase